MRYGIREGGLETFAKGMDNLARIVGDLDSFMKGMDNYFPCMTDFSLKDAAHARAIAESMAREVIVLGDESGILEHYFTGYATKVYPNNGYNIIVVPKRGLIYEDEVDEHAHNVYVNSLDGIFILGDTSFVEAVCTSTETARMYIRWFLGALYEYHQNMTDYNLEVVLGHLIRGRAFLREVLNKTRGIA